jgi:hypothetical protein
VTWHPCEGKKRPYFRRFFPVKTCLTPDPYSNPMLVEGFFRSRCVHREQEPFTDMYKEARTGNNMKHCRALGTRPRPWRKEALGFWQWLGVSAANGINGKDTTEGR